MCQIGFRMTTLWKGREVELVPLRELLSGCPFRFHHTSCTQVLHCLEFDQPTISQQIAQSSILALASSSLAMNSSNPPIGALIIVPIFIAASAAFVALKTQHGFQAISLFCRRTWNRRPNWAFASTETRNRKQKRSNARSYAYADSWYDLESAHSSQSIDPFSPFVGQSPVSKSYSEGDLHTRYNHTPTPSEVWHPARSNRLLWSFRNPESKSPRRSELSNVARPSPVAHRPERLSADDAHLLVHPLRVRGARRWIKKDR
jgi:hypothetical protein